MSADRLALEWIPGRYAICRLPAATEIPAWAVGGQGLVSITRTEAELSIVVAEGEVPDEATADRGWVALRVVGTLEFSVVGVLAKLSGALAEAGVSVFAISTYQTDILLVKSADATRAVKALATVSDVTRLKGCESNCTRRPGASPGGDG